MNTYIVEIKYTDKTGKNIVLNVGMCGNDIIDVVNQVYHEYDLSKYDNFSVGEIRECVY